MLELAHIFRAAGPAYRQAYAARMLPSHLAAMRDIERCRTAAFGGHLCACDRCGARSYSYHSCRNRHCPKCHTDQTRRWLDQQRARLLPCPYFLVTFTLPAELRPLARSHQKLVYGRLMRAAAQALLKLTADPDYLGARPGLLAVLHTWTRAMLYHPHVHILITAGGWSNGRDPRWVPAKRPQFLVPGRALSLIFRAKFRDALRTAGLLHQVPVAVWTKHWVVHLQHAGNGEQVLDYLARYVFRIALVNRRLEHFHHGQVTFRFRDGRSGKTQRCTLDAGSFIARFLQHVLPQRLAKVRHYGLFSPAHKPCRENARACLAVLPARAPRSAPLATDRAAPSVALEPRLPRCPLCGIGVLQVIETLPRARPPP